MAYLDFDGKKIEIDDEGYIQNADDWSKELAEFMAKADGVELTDDHWALIDFMKEYFAENGQAPSIRNVAKKVASVCNLPNVRAGNKHMYVLFPKGPALMLVRYAGMSKPTGCV